MNFQNETQPTPTPRNIQPHGPAHILRHRHHPAAQSTRRNLHKHTITHTHTLTTQQPHTLMPRHILITTARRGVWYAQVEDNQDLTPTTLQNLRNARMAIYWGTNRGIHQLCETGPTDQSRISAPADILVLHEVTAVFTVTDQAAALWNLHPSHS